MCNNCGSRAKHAVTCTKQDQDKAKYIEILRWAAVGEAEEKRKALAVQLQVRLARNSRDAAAAAAAAARAASGQNDDNNVAAAVCLIEDADKEISED